MLRPSPANLVQYGKLHVLWATTVGMVRTVDDKSCYKSVQYVQVLFEEKMRCYIPDGS
jgi:hypothetical protein